MVNHPWEYHLGALLKILFEEDVEQPIVSLTSSEQVDRQIKGYLEKSCTDYESDPLQWWYSRKDEFPVIAILAKSAYVFVELVFHLNAFSVKFDTWLVTFVTDYHQIPLTC